MSKYEQKCNFSKLSMSPKSRNAHFLTKKSACGMYHRQNNQTKTIYFGGGRRFGPHLGVTRTVAHDYLCFAVVIEDVSSIWYSRFALGT